MSDFQLSRFAKKPHFLANSCFRLLAVAPEAKTAKHALQPYFISI
jgi:hypothetical protein